MKKLFSFTFLVIIIFSIMYFTDGFPNPVDEDDKAIVVVGQSFK